MRDVCRSSVLTTVLVLLCTVGYSRTKKTPHSDPNDKHGGVVMGVPNDFCDNGKDYIEIDWNPKSKKEYTCTTKERKKGIKEYHKEGTCTKDALRPLHKCYPIKIDYSADPLPTSGPHRPLWPKYGEYTYLPPQRWLHSLEHGAIAFLYHPCANHEEIEIFKSVAKGCLRRHVISPYKEMPADVNFVLLAWKCKLMLKSADLVSMVDFVKKHALDGPEHVHADGQYAEALTEPAKIVTDIKDSGGVCKKFATASLTSLLDKIQRESKSRLEAAQIIDEEIAEDFARLQKRSDLYN